MVRILLRTCSKAITIADPALRQLFTLKQAAQNAHLLSVNSVFCPFFPCLGFAHEDF